MLLKRGQEAECSIVRFFRDMFLDLLINLMKKVFCALKKGVFNCYNIETSIGTIIACPVPKLHLVNNQLLQSKAHRV